MYPYLISVKPRDKKSQTKIVKYTFTGSNITRFSGLAFKLRAKCLKALVKISVLFQYCLSLLVLLWAVWSLLAQGFRKAALLLILPRACYTFRISQ